MLSIWRQNHDYNLDIFSYESTFKQDAQVIHSHMEFEKQESR